MGPPLDDDGRMDDAVQAYLDAIDAEQRPLFDRVHGLIIAAHPDATVRISYEIPTYEVGPRRLYLGVWQHGVSLYGWGAGSRWWVRRTPP